MKTPFRTWLRTRRGRQLTWAFVALALYGLIGFLVVPWVLGGVLPKYAGELLGRTVTIEKVRINPFVLSGSFQGLVVEDADGSPLLSWAEVYGNFQLSSLFHRALTFKELRVVDPYAHLQINPDYSFNFTDILERMEQESEAAPSGEPPHIPSFRFEDIVISNAIVKASDLTLREPFHRQIGPVDLRVEKLYTHPDSENPYSIAGTTESGERFAWGGRFFLFPLRSDGQVSVENLHIPSYSPFYHDFLSLRVSDGVIDLSTSYRLELNGTNNTLSVSNAMFHLASFKVNADTDSTRNALEISDLKVSGVQADLRDRTVRLASVTVDGGSLFVHRNQDRTLNLVEMTQPSITNAEPAGAVLFAMRAATNLISTFLYTTNHAEAVIDQLEVNDWTVELWDDVYSRPVRLRIDAIRLSGKNLSNVPGENLSLGVECRWNTNGTIKLGVDASLFPIHSDMSISVERIDVAPLDPYLEPFASVLLLDSKFSMEGVTRIRRDAVNAPFDLGFRGDLSLCDFSSVEGLMGTDLLEWRSVELSDVEANLHPLTVRVGQVGIHDARARLVLETNRTVNMLNAIHVDDRNGGAALPELTDAEAQPSTADKGAGPAAMLADLGMPEITVVSTLISNAQLDMVDLSTDPALRWTVTHVNGRIGALCSTNFGQAELQMTARAGGTAPVEIVGKLNPLNPAVDSDIAVRLQDMDLLPFDPYSGRYAGYQLRKGSLSLDLHYHIKGRKLDSDNLIVVDQLSLGQKVDSPEATKLPIKMGVAVLKDREGVIKLDVPIEGDLDDPEFRLGRVIGRTIMITLTKVLASPFSLLAGLTGGSSEELSTFEFPPGESTIQPNATNGLQKLSVALYERPALEVEIQGSVAPENDGLAIRRQKLTRQLQQMRWQELRESARAETKPEELVLSPDIRLAMLRKCYLQAFPDEARSSTPPPGLEEAFYERLTDRLLEQIEVDETDFRQLANARAETIRTHLIEKGDVDPARLFLTTGDVATPHDGSRVTLQLQ